MDHDRAVQDVVDSHVVMDDEVVAHGQDVQDDEGVLHCSSAVLVAVDVVAEDKAEDHVDHVVLVEDVEGTVAVDHQPYFDDVGLADEHMVDAQDDPDETWQDGQDVADMLLVVVVPHDLMDDDQVDQHEVVDALEMRLDHIWVLVHDEQQPVIYPYDVWSNWIVLDIEGNLYRKTG